MIRHSGFSSPWLLNVARLAVLASLTVWSSTAPAQSHEQHTSTQATAGWIATGSGVGLLSAFGYAYYRVNDVNQDASFSAYRDGTAAGADACDAADRGVVVANAGAASPGEMQDMCATGDRWRVLGNYVFLPLGVISLGTGIYLLASDDSDKPSEHVALRLETTVQPQGGALRLRGTF